MNRIVVTCAKGIAPCLATELRQLGFSVASEMAAGVITTGTLADTMKLNLHLRTGQRVLYSLATFAATSAGDLYERMLDLPWEKYLPADGYVCVTSAVHTPAITDTRFANLKCKDAIVDRLKRKRGRRPDSGPARDRAVVFFHWHAQQCQVYLDTSGEPLARRGYRKLPAEAPMQETLAAAVILATAWEGDSHFVNPMCGSGTLAIEAALLARRQAPGLLRQNFGFMHLLGYESSAWERLRQQALRQKRAATVALVASDWNEEALAAARENARLAGVESALAFHRCDFAQTPMPAGPGVVMFNPEYGRRMGEVRQLEQTYARIGDFFKQRCAGFRGYIFTGNLELAKKVGLRTQRRLTFYNGEIECRLLEYELYAGSRKSRDRNDATSP